MAAYTSLALPHVSIDVPEHAALGVPTAADGRFEAFLKSFENKQAAPVSPPKATATQSVDHSITQATLDPVTSRVATENQPLATFKDPPASSQLGFSMSKSNPATDRSQNLSSGYDQGSRGNGDLGSVTRGNIYTVSSSSKASVGQNLPPLYKNLIQASKDDMLSVGSTMTKAPEDSTADFQALLGKNLSITHAPVLTSAAVTPSPSSDVSVGKAVLADGSVSSATTANDGIANGNILNSNIVPPPSNGVTINFEDENVGLPENEAPNQAPLEAPEDAASNDSAMHVAIDESGQSNNMRAVYSLGDGSVINITIQSPENKIRLINVSSNDATLTHNIKKTSGDLMGAVNAVIENSSMVSDILVQRENTGAVTNVVSISFGETFAEQKSFIEKPLNVKDNLEGVQIVNSEKLNRDKLFSYNAIDLEA